MDTSSASIRAERSKKGPYLRAHNKLSLGLDRLLPAIASVEASTLELVRTTAEEEEKHGRAKSPR